MLLLEVILVVVGVVVYALLGMLELCVQTRPEATVDAGWVCLELASSSLASASSLLCLAFLVHSQHLHLPHSFLPLLLKGVEEHLVNYESLIAGTASLD